MRVQMPIRDTDDALLSETVLATDMWMNDMSKELGN